MTAPAIHVIDQVLELADVHTALAPGTLTRQEAMPLRPWAASPTLRKVVDATNSQFGITWVAEPDAIKWRGLYYAIADVNNAGGTTEGATGQRIGLLTSPDKIAWTFVGLPFSDASLADSTVITDSAAHFQGSIFAPLGDAGPLEAYFTNGKLYVSSLSAPGALWHNRRFWWQNSNEPVLLDTVINGNTPPVSPAGLDFRPTIDGHLLDVGMTFFSRPLALSDDWTIVPAIGRSSDLDTGVAATESTFTRQWKSMFCLLRDPEGNWSRSEPVPCGPTSTPGGLWESFVVEADNRDLYLYGLNKLGTNLPQNAMWVSVSSDRGKTWSQTRDTEMQVPTQRAMAIRSANGRYWMLGYDMPAANVTGTLASPSTNSGTSRYNMAAFVSRRGVDDFVPALQLSDQELTAQYGQVMDDGDALVAVWHRDHADSNPHGRDLWLTETAQPTDPDVAYVYPRHQTERTPHGPTLRTVAPTGYHFDGTRQATAAAAISGVTGLTLGGWISPVAGTTDAQVVCDVRDNTGARAGAVMRPDGVALRSIVVRHGLTVTRSQPVYVAASIDFTARTVTVVAYQGATFQTVTHTLQAITFTGAPADQQTVTIDGTLYTFEANTPVDALSGLPTTPGKVLLGGDATASALNLAAVLTSSVASVVGTVDMIVKRADGADFTITPGTAPISVLSALPSTLTNANCVPRVGGKSATSSTLPYFVGDMIDVQVWSKALTVAQMKSVCNQHTADAGIGYATVSGASAPSGSPSAHLDANADTTGWPDLTTAASTATVSGNVVTITGEASASIELPFKHNALAVPVQLPDVANGDHVTLMHFDTAAHSIELAADRAAGVTTLSLAGRTVGTLTDPTRLNLLRVVATDKTITVGNVIAKRTAPGNVRAFLGCAFPTGRLAPPKRTIFDLTDATVADYRGADLLDDRAHLAIPVAGAAALTDAQLDALLPWPQPPVPVVADPNTGQFAIRTGLAGVPWTRVQGNVSTDGSTGSFPKQYKTLPGNTTDYGHLLSLKTSGTSDACDVLLLVTVGGDAGVGVHGAALMRARIADNTGTTDTALIIATLIPFDQASGRVKESSFSAFWNQVDSTHRQLDLWVALEDPNARVFVTPLEQIYRVQSGNVGDGGITFYDSLPNPRVTALPTGTTVTRQVTSNTLTGSGAPASTPLYIGQVYVDTAASPRAIYQATNTSSSADWKQLATSGAQAYLELADQGSAPATPSGGSRLYVAAEGNGAEVAKLVSKDGSVDQLATLVDTDYTRPSAGVEPFRRDLSASTGISMTSGQGKLRYFQAWRTESINTIYVPNGATAAVLSGAGALGRIGIFSVNTTDWSLTALLAACATDLSILNNASNETAEALTSTWSKVRGVWYCYMLLVVTTGSLPNTVGSILGNAQIAAGGNGRPRLAGNVSGLTDLPSSVAAGSITNTNQSPYFFGKP